MGVAAAQDAVRCASGDAAKAAGSKQPQYGAHLTTSQFVVLVTALALGTMLEWYDFFSFAQMNSILTQVFFPTKDPAMQQLSFWGVFFIGFLARPVGAIIFGHIGDTRGRRLTLLMSIVGMAVPTVLIGCLPSYEQAGIAAPVLLALLRLLQGVSMGGEFGSSLVYLHEIAEQRRQGFVGSIGFASAVSGCMVGVLVVLIVESIFSPAQMLVFGWRLPFLITIVSAATAFALRLHMPEPFVFIHQQEALKQQQVEVVAAYRHTSSLRCSDSGAAGAAAAAAAAAAKRDALDLAEGGAYCAAPSKQAAAAAGARSGGAGKSEQAATPSSPRTSSGGGCCCCGGWSQLPVVMLLRWHWAAVLLQCAFEAWVSCSFYTLTTWLPLQMTVVLGIPTNIVRGMLIVNLMVCVALQLAAGAAADRGLPRLWSSCSVFAIGGAIIAPIMLLGMRPGALGAAWVLHALLLALVGWALGLIPMTCSVIYPAAVRTSGFNLGHNMSMSWLGGLSPTIVQALTAATGKKFLSPTILLAAAAGVSLVAGLILIVYAPAANRRPDDATVEVEE